MQTTSIGQTRAHLGRLITLLRGSAQSLGDCAESVQSKATMSAVFREISRERTVQANTLMALLDGQIPEVAEKAALAEAKEIWCDPPEGSSLSRVAYSSARAEEQLRSAFLEVLRHVSAAEVSEVLWRFYATIKEDLERIRLWSRE